MATIMERIRNIVQSEVSDFVEKHEDPDKVINQTIADAMVTFTNLRKELEPLQATFNSICKSVNGISEISVFIPSIIEIIFNSRFIIRFI